MITIIVPTYNRPSLIIRLIEFYKNYKFCKLLILDSSNKKIIKNKYADQDKINVIEFSSDIFISEKIIYSTQYIETDYVVLCADDDTIIPSSLMICKEFLENNKEFASAQGWSYPNIFLTPRKDKNYNQKCYEDNEYNKRIFNYLSFKFGNTFYALHKKSAFVKTWNKNHISINMWEFFEFITSVTSLVQGKSKYINIPYHIRTVNDYNWINEKKINVLYKPENINNFLNDISLLNSKYNIDIDILKIKKVITKHYNSLIENEKKRKNKILIKKFLKFISFGLINFFFKNKHILKIYSKIFLSNMFRNKFKDEFIYEYNLIRKTYDKAKFSEVNSIRETY